MTSAALGFTPPAISPEVLPFAAEKGVSDYLGPVIEVARQAFPSSRLTVSVGQDLEVETHRYIAINVDIRKLDAEQLIAGQNAWATGLGQVCPSRYTVYFVLGWR